MAGGYNSSQQSWQEYVEAGYRIAVRWPARRTASADTQRIIDRLQQGGSNVHAASPAQHEHVQTPLVDLPSLADALGVKAVAVKDEGQRLGLGAFKGLGVAYAVSRLMESGSLKVGDTVTTMTDGNHGKAVAHIAAQHGLNCVVYVPACMKPARVAAIEAEGARVEVVDGSYDDSIAMVRSQAQERGWTIVSDTAWEGYTDIPLDIMTGYTLLFQEVQQQAEVAGMLPFTHVMLQAGVGGFAAAGIVAMLGSPLCRPIIVEPTDADCILENIVCGQAAASDLASCKGATNSIMSGLNCGEPSTVAWPVLRDLAAGMLACGDSYARRAVRLLHSHSGGTLVAGESGAAGLAGLVALREQAGSATGRGKEWRQAVEMLQLGSQARVLVINTENDTDPEAYREIISGSS